MFYVPQLGNQDCGFACLKMLLANALHDSRYLHLPCDENHGPYSYRDLESIAAENGVTLVGFKVGAKDEIYKCTTFPIIVRIKTEKDGRHAVIIKKLNKRRAVIFDPHLGKYKMKTSDLLKIWDGSGLFITQVKKTFYIYENFEPIPKRKKFFAFLMQTISGVLIAIGMYFITPDGPYLMSILFLVLGLLMEIVLRGYLYKLMASIDTYFENKYEDVNVSQYYDYFVRSQNFKKNYLSSGLKLVYSILISVFIIFLVIFNNPLNFPLIITAILVAAIEELYFKKKEARKLTYLADQEARLKEKMNKDEMIMKVKRLQSDAYKFSRYNLTKKYLGVFICLVSAILVAILTNTFTLTNIIFILCIEIFLYQNLMPIFSFEKLQEEALVDKAKLSNVFYRQVHHIDEKDGK